MTFHRVKKAGLVWKCSDCMKWHLSKRACGEGESHTTCYVGVVK